MSEQSRPMFPIRMIVGNKHRDLASQTIQSPSLHLSVKPDNIVYWSKHWQNLGQTWRTEPEIDVERQKYLAERRAIVPDMEKGIYPFKDIKLSRADVEWLLATHENGRGPVNWSDESQREREGLDLRGADLRRTDLHGLPLAYLKGSSGIQLSFRHKAAAIHLEEAYLAEIHLEGAILDYAHLEKATLYGAHLEGAHLYGIHLKDAELIEAHLESAVLTNANLVRANLSGAHLENALLIEAHLERAEFRRMYFFHTDPDTADQSEMTTHLEGADLDRAHLDRAALDGACLDEANLSGASLKGAFLSQAYFKGASLIGAHLEGAYLDRTHLEGADLREVFFNTETQLINIFLGDARFGFASLADVRWGDTNLALVTWSSVKKLGDEIEAERLKKGGETTQLLWYRRAVRANRQLAIALQAQGLNEFAARFAYRAQLMQRKVIWYQRKFGQYLFSMFLDLLTGYGYKPIRSFITYGIVISLFAFIYFLLGSHLAWNEAIVISMTAFHGRGFFPEQFKPGDPQALVAAIEAFVGLLIEVTFIATLTQRLFGK